MIRVLSAPIASASAAWVRIDDRSRAEQHDVSPHRQPVRIEHGLLGGDHLPQERRQHRGLAASTSSELGRTAEVRAPSPKESAATRVLALPIEAASAKIRTGGPLDNPEDESWPCWAGEIPSPSLRALLSRPPSVSRSARRLPRSPPSSDHGAPADRSAANSRAPLRARGPRRNHRPPPAPGAALRNPEPTFPRARGECATGPPYLARRCPGRRWS